MEGYQISVGEKILQQDMYYKNTIIMKYTIKYPKFISSKYRTLTEKLNTLYKTKAVMYERSNIMNLYQMAMVEFEYAIANNFPVRVFEAYVDFTVTYNQNCTISLYFDQYEYTGGAHGLTIRYSDTWNLQKSKRMDLSEFFDKSISFREYIKKCIQNQIAVELATQPAKYFDNYVELVNENFKFNNFYLVDEGIVVYFQQYDMAPYATGIPTFLIPFVENVVNTPQCT